MVTLSDHFAATLYISLTRCREGDIMRCREMVRDTDHFCPRALFCWFFHSNMLFDMLNHIFDIVFEISIGGKMRKGKLRFKIQTFSKIENSQIGKRNWRALRNKKNFWDRQDISRKNRLERKNGPCHRPFHGNGLTLERICWIWIHFRPILAFKCVLTFSNREKP